MVTGIGYCGRIGKRKREKQIRQLCENPCRFHFYPPSRTKKRKLIIISKDGKKTIFRKNKI